MQDRLKILKRCIHERKKNIWYIFWKAILEGWGGNFKILNGTQTLLWRFRLFKQKLVTFKIFFFKIHLKQLWSGEHDLDHDHFYHYQNYNYHEIIVTNNTNFINHYIIYLRRIDQTPLYVKKCILFEILEVKVTYFYLSIRICNRKGAEDVPRKILKLPLIHLK